MSDFLESNLAAFEKHQPTTAKRIREVENTDKVSFELAKSEDVNILFDGKPCHSPINPYEESRLLFERGVPEDARDFESLYVFMGLGLGYLMQRAYVESDAQIIIFEPNIEVVRATFEMVDFEEILESQRVKIITRIEDFLSIFHEMHIMGDKLQTIIMPEYQAHYGRLCVSFLEEVKSALYHNIINQNTGTLLGQEFIKTSLHNVHDVLKYPGPGMFHDKMGNYPGVVVSAGPSLDKPGVLETLKANQDNMIIACVGQAARALDKAGIVPHFVYIIEFSDVSRQLDGVSFLDKTNLILLPQTHSSIYRFDTKRKFVVHNYSDSFTDWLTETTGLKFDHYHQHGTVSLSCLIFLNNIGCKTIYLLGQDLCYPDGKMYASDSVYENARVVTDEDGQRIVKWDDHVVKDLWGKKGFFASEEELKQRSRSIVKDMVEVKGWYGETLYAPTDYTAFGKGFEHIKDVMCADSTLINCSEGGRYLNGYEHMVFSQAVETYALPAQELNATQYIESICQQYYTEADNNDVRFAKVNDQICYDVDSIEQMIDQLKENIDLVQKGVKELQTRKVVTDSLKDYLKRLDVEDQVVTQYCKEHRLINQFVKGDLYLNERKYMRKQKRNTQTVEEVMNDPEALKENLEVSGNIYRIIKKGAERLLETLNEVKDELGLNTEDYSNEYCPATRRKISSTASYL